MIPNTQNINFTDNKIDLANKPIINKQRIISVDNIENKVCATDTKYWNMLSDELVEKICTYLDARSLFACRASCHRNKRVIENIPCGLQVKRNISLFANTYTDNIPINYMVTNFIVFIEKNNLVNKQELPKIKFLLKHFKYYGIQYVLAKISKNITYSFKSICVIHSSMLTFYETKPIVCFNHLTMNENSNTYLYVSIKFLCELKIQANNVFVSKRICDISHLKSNNEFTIIMDLFTYKKNVIISFDNHFNTDIIFLHKIDDHYYNITPESLKATYRTVVGIQTDNQGNNISIHINFRKNVVECYYMPNHNSNLNAKNIITYNCDCITISIENFKIHNVKISKTNNLMIIYGRNKNLNIVDSAKKAHIYKDNIKIHTCYIENSGGYLGENIIHCSHKGNHFTITEKTSNKKTFLRFYKIDNNQVKEIGTVIIKTSDYLLRQIIYNNTGDMLFIPEKDTNYKLLYFTAENSIKKINIHEADSYGFNKSGCMFLQINDDIITIHNFQNKNCFKKLQIKCIEEATQAEFSPNSQLVITRENSLYAYKTLRIYKIMDLDKNNNLKMLSEAKYIKGHMVSSDTLFKVHPDGTKLIVYTSNHIEILSLIP